MANGVSSCGIEVITGGAIQVRQATIIERDGEFVSRTFHRWVLTTKYLSYH